MFSFSGLASGLDTQAIIDALVQVERIPIQLLEQQKAEQQTKLDLIGTFKGHVQDLKSKADQLRSPANFLEFDVSASVEGIADFSADGSAVEGSHTLQVVSLAQADRWAFDGVADPDADLATADGQSVDFTVNGTSYSVAVTQAASSLNEIASAINDLAGNDVTATVVNVGTSASPSYQLVLASDDTGEDARITNISSSIAGLTIDGTPPDAQGQAQSANNITVGMNAEAIIDGLTVTRADNSFDDVIPGVSIDLLSDASSQEITFTVSADREGMKAKIQDFVDAYNQVIQFINAQNTYDEDDGPGGALFGDSLLRSVRSDIHSALFDVDLDTVTADSEGYSTLGLVGIDIQDDGTLLVDSTTLDEKMSENLDLFVDLFADTDGFDNGGAAENTPEYYIDTTADSGLADTLYRHIERMFGVIDSTTDPPIKGLFDARTEALNAMIDDFDGQIEAKQFYLDRFEQRLVERFAALEELMASLNAQGDALANALLQLPGANNS